MYKVYWTNPDTNESHSKDFEDLSASLKECEQLRQSGRTFVTMVSENPNMVGKAGAGVIVDGKLPSGEKYEYTKRDTLSQRTKSPPVSTDNLIVDLDDPH